MGKVVMNASVSVDGFIAAEDDDPGPIFEWLVSGDVPLDDSGVLKVSQASFDYVRPYWDEIGVTVAGRLDRVGGEDAGRVDGLPVDGVPGEFSHLDVDPSLMRHVRGLVPSHGHVAIPGPSRVAVERRPTGSSRRRHRGTHCGRACPA